MISPRHHAPWLCGMRPGGRFLYTEERMHEGGLLYVAGEFHTFSGGRPGLALERAAADLLAAWKRNQAALVTRFDTNGDGRVDGDQWEVARTRAHAEVATR
ncbi:hypothetical protein, partial [Rhodanobacter lindaniclasticus]